jgi:hypothetical protein
MATTDVAVYVTKDPSTNEPWLARAEMLATVVRAISVKASPVRNAWCKPKVGGSNPAPGTIFRMR